LISDLLLEVLPRRRASKPAPFSWKSSGGDLRVDLLDKDGVYDQLDAEKLARR
jgi:hypothetical protein